MFKFNSSLAKLFWTRPLCYENFFALNIRATQNFPTPTIPPPTTTTTRVILNGPLSSNGSLWYGFSLVCDIINQH